MTDEQKVRLAHPAIRIHQGTSRSGLPIAMLLDGDRIIEVSDTVEDVWAKAARYMKEDGT